MSTAPLLEEQEKIIIIDFGSPYNQLLTRTIRELGMYSELHPHTIKAEELKSMNAKGVILSGGPLTAGVADAYQLDMDILSLDIPVLGMCYGTQLIVNHFDGDIKSEAPRSYEVTTMTVDGESKLLANQATTQEVLESVGHTIERVPEGFDVLAKNTKGNPLVIEDANRHVYGIMYHPEVEQSTAGIDFLKHFIFEVCASKGDWSMARFAKLEVEKIRATVGDKKVLCALSGGVDSSVVAALIHKAIGDQLTCMFVDHGLLRKGEAESVVDTFQNKFNMNFIKIDAQDRFLDKLAGEADPEKKRKIIGNEFIYVFDDEAAKLEGIDFLAQGTLYTDILESGTLTSETIKSHHNVGGLPEDMEFELIEPLGALFKDEVRALGTELGLSDEIVWRQPFPGPGLGIRVLGEVTREKLAIVRESDAILREEIANAGLERDVWQYFTVLPDIRSVGVKNGERTYDYAVGIRAVTSVDGTTSGVAEIPWDILSKISQRITAEVDHVNRVLYDITGKPPGTIEWE